MAVPWTIAPAAVGASGRIAVARPVSAALGAAIWTVLLRRAVSVPAIGLGARAVSRWRPVVVGRPVRPWTVAVPRAVPAARAIAFARAVPGLRAVALGPVPGPGPATISSRRGVPALGVIAIRPTVAVVIAAVWRAVSGRAVRFLVVRQIPVAAGAARIPPGRPAAAWPWPLLPMDPRVGRDRPRGPATLDPALFNGWLVPHLSRRIMPDLLRSLGTCTLSGARRLGWTDDPERAQPLVGVGIAARNGGLDQGADRALALTRLPVISTTGLAPVFAPPGHD
jgi:hypothetical protein